MTVPSPSGGPSKFTLACGSSFAHGDQASHLWKSLTWAKTSAWGAAIVMRPIDLELGGLQGDDNDEDEDDCRQSDEDLLQHRSFPGFWLNVAAGYSITRSPR